jgi:tRNA(fMet)-specific endonuclease VapC
MSKPLYLLDTNILVHAARRDATWERIKEQYDPFMREPSPVYSFVSDGELRSLAKQWNWGEDKVEQMEYVLQYFLRVTLENNTIVEAYATLDAFSRVKGIKMGKNDLWIAASAYCLNAVLLTEDTDFDHLNNVFIQVAGVQKASIGED